MNSQWSTWWFHVWIEYRRGMESMSLPRRVLVCASWSALTILAVTIVLGVR
jgi:hypothetical protein